MVERINLSWPPVLARFESIAVAAPRSDCEMVDQGTIIKQ